MAQLPLVTERSVKPSGETPGFLQVNYSPDAFGAGIGRALQQAGGQLQQTAMVEKALRSEVKANDALKTSAAMEDELRPWLWDPNDGMLAKKGGNAMGTGAQAAVVMDKIKKDYLSKIDDPETKAAVEKMWFRTTEATKDKLAAHELNELGNYKTDTTKGIIFGSMQDAYNQFNDPKAIELAIDKTRKAVRANTAGQPPELVVAAENEAISGIHLAAISRWAAEDPYKALDYYKSHSGELSGKDHVTATGLVETARQERSSQEWVAQRTGSGSQATHNLYAAVEFAESGGNAGAVSDAGALGNMQLMPDTARETAQKLGYARVSQMTDKELKAFFATPEGSGINRLLGQTYLDQQLKAYGGDVEAALVAYNAGPGGADAFLKHNVGRKPGQRDYNVPGWKGIKDESEAYVQKVLGKYGVGTPNDSRMTPENWTLRNFRPEDLLAPTAGGQWIDAATAQALDTVADEFMAQFPGVRIKVNEAPSSSGETAGRRRGTSDPKDNPHVENSQHVHGTALDVQIQGMNDVQKAAFLSLARQKGFGGIGFYGPNGHLHIDRGNPRTWGRMPAWAKDAMRIPVKGVTGRGRDTVSPPAFGGTGGTGQTAQPGGAYYADTQKPALAALLEESNSILDAGERERTQAKLRVWGAQQEAAAAATMAANKQEAWNTVIQGSINDLQPEQLARLEPSFVSSLYAFAENKAKGVMPMDWQKWSEVSMMPPEQLKTIDPYDYRNVLDDSHFDKLLELTRASRKDDTASKALLANTRTRAQIVSDAVGMLNLGKTTGDAHKQREGLLNRQLDERILAEQQAKGKELNSLEIQDIVDKLLITDKSTWGTNYSGDAETPDTFVAAESWEEVQADDQEQLVSFYTAVYGRDPDKETATDLYNRAMRVYLGGKPSGPDEEKAAVRSQADAALGYKLTDSAFERYYGKWLLRTLGR